MHHHQQQQLATFSISSQVHLPAKKIRMNPNSSREENSLIKTKLDDLPPKFVDLETGYCLVCGLVHSFASIDEWWRRHQNRSVPKVFWENQQ
jgi:hypothetical protein